MLHLLARFLTTVALALLLLAPASAQVRRELYRKPENAQEYWRAIQFEINVGRFDLAAEYLKAFLASNPSDEDLLQIQDREGSSAFLRLLTIPELRATAQPLVEKVEAVVKKHLSDPKRIDKFIRNLNATEEERAYAITQLRRSGAYAVPQLIEALLRTQDEQGEHAAILTALLRLNRDIVPPLVAALDVDSPQLRYELVDVLQRRRDLEAAPHLWYVAGSPKNPEALRKKATTVLSEFLDIAPDKLPPAKVALTNEAERYYQHKVRFPDPKAVTVWRWDGMQLVSQTVPATQAEEYFGLRFARHALDLDPTYQPAQVVFLSLALDKGFQKAGLDQPLAKGAPEVKELLAAVNPDLVTAVLERALQEKRLPVVLGAVRALGDLAEVRAARPTGSGTPALARALYYPDRRVQLAAVDALLRVPAPTVPFAPSRVVEILRRAVAADAQPRALVADFNTARGKAVADVVQKAGYTPVLVATGREALQRLNEAADIDVIVLDAGVPDPQLPHLLAQLRADADVGLLPILIVAPPDQVERLRLLTERYRHVRVLPATTDPAAVQTALTSAVTEAMGAPLSEAERKDQTAEALLWLARLARGEVQGYDIRPAEAAVLQALRSDELANVAIEVAGRLPGRMPQRELAALVLNQARPAPLRSKAALELCRHIQQNGLALTRDQAQNLETLYTSLEDAKLKSNVALIIGSLRPTARQTGERLQRYTPALAAPAPAAEEKPKEAETKEK